MEELKVICRTFADTGQLRTVTLRCEKSGRNEVDGVQAGKESDILRRCWADKVDFEGNWIGC
jgi:hypothetical protein